MPQAVGAAVVSAFQFIAGNAVLRFIATVAISLVLGKILGPKAPKTSFAGLQSTSRGALEYRKFGYGRALVGGTIFWNNTRGTDNEWMDFQVAYVDHFADIISFKLDETDVAKALITWTEATTNGGSGSGNGEVTGIAKYVGTNSVLGLEIQWYQGWTDQPANAKIIAGYTELDSNHRARGIFNAAFSLRFDVDTEKVWEKGAIQDFLALLDLRRVFDRRKYALNADPDFDTAKAPITSGRVRWFGDNAQTIAIDLSFIQAFDTLTLANNTDSSEFAVSERFPVNTGNLYTAQGNARQTGGDRVNTLSLAFYDSGGSLIPPGSETGWASLGANYFHFFALATFPGTYTVQSQQFGTSGGQIPAGAVTMALVGRFCGVGTSISTIDIRDFAIYENTLAARHDLTDDTTWEWTDNPAVCLADYLFTYMDVDPADEIDWEANIIAAQACDVSVSVPAGNQNRFRCNGTWTSNESHELVLENLKASMAGRLIYTGGVWVMQAGVWEAPTLSFDENSLAGDVEVEGSVGRDLRYNIVRGFYADKDRDYKTVEFYPAENSAYVTRDGGRELEFETDLRFTNDEYESQRIAIRKLDQFDNMLVARMVMNEQGAKVYPGLIVDWSLSEFSWTNKDFRCIQWLPREDGNFDVTFKEDFSTRYDDPLVGEYTTKNAAGVITPGVQAVPPPTGLATAGKEGSVLLTWTNAPNSLYDLVEIWHSTTDDINTATLLAEVRASSYITITGDVTERFYWIRSKANVEDFSVYEPVTTEGVSGTATSAGIVQWNYIKKLNGAQIQNGVGTLTLEARDVTAGVDTLLSAGTIQLYVGSTLVTVANGFATGSDGYTGVFDAGDITGSVLVELKDGPAGAIIDSETLVDTLDGPTGGAGANAIYGIVEPENGVSWTRATNQGAWTPSQLTTDLDIIFFQNAVEVARIARRITLTSSNGTLAATTVTHKGGDLNTSRVTVTVTGSASTAITVQFDYSFGGENSTVAETVTSSQGGDDGATGGTGNDGLDAVTGFVEPENGLAWTRATTGGAWTPSQLTTDLDCTFILGNTVVARIARRVTLTDATGNLAVTTTAHKGGNLNTGRVTVTVTGGGSTAVTVQFDYSDSGDTGTTAATAASAQGGDDGVLHYLTNEAHVLSANFDGLGYSLAGSGGTHKVFEGTSDETANATHEIVGGVDGGANWTKVQNGLTMTMVEATGVYSLSGAAWTTNSEIFTLRAVFNGVNYDKEYVIAKAIQGSDGGCAVDTLTAINFDDAGVNDPATCGFRVDNNGDIFTRPDAAAGYSSKETWIGACVNSDYECIFNHTGDALTGGSSAVDTWLVCSTDRLFELSTSGAIKSCSGTLQIRRASDSVVVATVSISLRVETSA
jgi:hypothetical protein